MLHEIAIVVFSLFRIFGTVDFRPTQDSYRDVYMYFLCISYHKNVCNKSQVFYRENLNIIGLIISRKNIGLQSITCAFSNWVFGRWLPVCALDGRACMFVCFLRQSGNGRHKEAINIRN